MTQTHMAREISEIPVLVDGLLTRNADTLAEIGQAMRVLDPQLLTTVARGSSDHAASYLKYACEILTGVPVGSVGPSVASVYGAKLRLPRTVSVGISQSGRSPDIVTMTRASAAAGAITLAITNHPEAPAGRRCRLLPAAWLRPRAERGRDEKLFVTSVVAALAMLAHWTEDESLKAALDRLPEACAAALLQDWTPLAERFGARACALCAGARPRLCDCIGNRAEVQGNQRHPCRSLFGGRGAARPLCAGRTWLSGAGTDF